MNENLIEFNVKLIKVPIICPIKKGLCNTLEEESNLNVCVSHLLTTFCVCEVQGKKQLTRSQLAAGGGHVTSSGGGEARQRGLFIRRRILISAASIDQMKRCASLAGVGT